MTQPFPEFLSFITSLDSSITISPTIILALAGAFAIFGIVITLLFEYHWKAYAVNKLEILTVRFWYYSGTVVFGGGMVISALLYAISI